MIKIIIALVVSLLTATSPSFALEPTERDGQLFCGESFINGLAIPADTHQDRSNTLRIMLINVDRSYMQIINGLHQLGKTLTEEKACKLKAYRLRASQFSHIRNEFKSKYDKALHALQIEINRANTLCEKYLISTKQWAECELNASNIRSRLKEEVRKTKFNWVSIAHAPDFATEGYTSYIVAGATARVEIMEALAEKIIINPKHLGSEVWCGDEWVRAAAKLGSPIEEFFDVLRLIPSSKSRVSKLSKMNEEKRISMLEYLESLKKDIHQTDLDYHLNDIVKLKSDYASWQCKETWLLKREIELVDVPNIIKNNYVAAQQALDEINLRCEQLKPESGWVAGNDHIAQDWAKCRESISADKKKAEGDLKMTQGYHNYLLSALRKGSVQ